MPDDPPPHIVDLDGAVYLDADVMAAAGFRPGDGVALHIEAGRIILVRAAAERA